MQKKFATLLALAAVLAACGGGGGNPGECLGSAQVCLDGGNPNISTTGNTTGNSAQPTPNTSGSTTTTSTTTTGTSTTGTN